MSGNVIKNLLLLLSLLLSLSALVSCASFSKTDPLVLITDFGVKDGAVSAMKGVATAVDSRVVISDLTHEVSPYNIWEAAFRLQQTYKFWPKGTVFVAVIDPGVGSERRSIVARTKSGHIFIGPDNGLFTLVGDESGFSDLRVFKENEYRRKGSEDSYTFHGRDLYAYVGAMLATGQLNAATIGESFPLTKVVRLNYQKAERAGGNIKGNVPVLDVTFGNVWSNIPRSMVLGAFPNSRKYRVQIFHKQRRIYDGTLPLVDTFSGVAKGAPLLYFNSMLNLSVALNMANFAQKYNISSGPDWSITVSPAK
jgi:S-adenosylmethionine hydrolase